MRTIDSIASSDYYLDSMDAWTLIVPMILLFAWTHGFLNHPETPMASMVAMCPWTHGFLSHPDSSLASMDSMVSNGFGFQGVSCFHRLCGYMCSTGFMGGFNESG
jgi:hypothetical protein